jgi:endoglucanase
LSVGAGGTVVDPGAAVVLGAAAVEAVVLAVVPVAAGAPSTTAAPGSTTVPPAPTDNPLAGMTFHGQHTAAARAAAQPGRSAEDTSALAELAAVPTATWLGAWSGDVTTAVRQVAAARAAGAVPVS